MKEVVKPDIPGFYKESQIVPLSIIKNPEAQGILPLDPKELFRVLGEYFHHDTVLRRLWIFMVLMKKFCVAII